MVDKRKSPDYQELRGFIPKTLSMQFKAVCKGLGENINDSLEEAVREWIGKQEQVEHNKPKLTSISRSSILPTIATAIEETLNNEQWILNQLSENTDIPINRLKKLLLGDRATDEEMKKLASNLVKFNGKLFEEEELVDMRLAEDLKQRQLRRELKCQKLERRKKQK